MAAEQSGRATRPAPMIIAHRGASGYLPEHTLAAYEMALDQGATCLESDLVATRDGRLLVRHDNLLNLTTDVAIRPEFADRRCSKNVDGVALDGWFTEDFTLADLLTLRARERIPELRPHSAAENDRHGLVSLNQMLTYVREQERLRGRQICFYLELKHPHYFASLGLAMEGVLVETLHRAGYTRRSDPICVQSFEVEALQKLRQRTDLKLMQLIGRKESQPWDQRARGTGLNYLDMITADGLTAIARYADAIGPPKYVSYTSADLLLHPSPDKIRELVQHAHAVGLDVVPYTFRAENEFLPPYWRSGLTRAACGDLRAEVRMFVDAGVDGLFIDNPDIGISEVASDRNNEAVAHHREH